MPLLRQEEVINYLAEIAMGNLSLTQELIEQESNPHQQELLFGLLCLHEDLELQRKEIASMTQYLENILQSLSDLLFIVDAKGIVQLCNSQVYQVLDIRPSDILQHSIQAFLRVDDSTPDQLHFSKKPFPLQHITSLITEGRFQEFPMLLEYNTTQTAVLVSGHTMQREEETEDLLILLAKDSEQSRLLKELKEKQLQLVQASKLASMGGLSSGIAHELNNPLFAVSGLTEVMQMRLQHGYPEAYAAVAPSIDNMLIATEKMRQIINHIRIFARQEQMVFEKCPINQIIQSSILLLQEQLRIHSITLTLQLSAEDPILRCAPNRLEQVFINLISNARDAIQERLQQEPAHIGEVHIRSILETDKIRVIFRDNGIGIAQSELDKIYDPFYSTKEVGKGTGLGLSISYSIIQEHKGEIVVQSAEGITEFEIQLPL